MPATELADAHVALESLWGGAARRLRERLCSAPAVEQRFRLLEAELCRRLAGSPRRHAAVAWAIDALTHGASVGDLAAQLSLSHRHFIALFSEQVGMRPKTFARVQRFQHVFGSNEALSEPDWSRLALLGGYYDQSHLIRDCIAFSGLSPSDLLRSRRAPLKQNHLAVMSR
jgi:AraC-like DNA-binding protein